MHLSTQVPGSHATPSPSGGCIASIANGRLRISPTDAPQNSYDFAIRVPIKDVASLRWDDGGERIAIVSASLVEVMHIDEPMHRVRIDNGSGGLGRLSSAEFVGPDHLLVVWEFGKAKFWNLSTGTAQESGDFKTAAGAGKRWQRRPGDGDSALRALATLSRSGAEDVLGLHFPALGKSMPSVKLPSLDARSLSWSPDGRWLAILESPTSSPGVHFYTPDGHHFRSYPSGPEAGSQGLGIKSLIWSRNSRVVALTRYDGKTALLNTRTFTPLAIIEHTTTIDQHLLSLDRQAPIWQEIVSASGVRSYNFQAQPFSPPLSRTKPSIEPSELGVAEACFSADGNYLATRDEQTLSTVWIWNISTLSAHAIVVQHTNIRRMHWHPSKPDTLLLDSGEGTAYLFSATDEQPPLPLTLDVPLPATLSWMQAPEEASPIILAASKQTFRLCYPEGQTNPNNTSAATHTQKLRTQNHGEEASAFDEGASEDSLFEVLSGRKPMHPRSGTVEEPSYTRRIDLEVEADDEADGSVHVDDTFVGKMKRGEVAVDPLDDSEFF